MKIKRDENERKTKKFIREKMKKKKIVLILVIMLVTASLTFGQAGSMNKIVPYETAGLYEVGPKAGIVGYSPYPGSGIDIDKDLAYSIEGRQLDFDSLNVSFVGNWPFGSSFSVTSDSLENIVFLGSGGGVEILDITNPSSPEKISEVRARSLVDDSFYDPSTNLLYLAAYNSGVEIWDLSDITSPVRIGRCPTPPYPRGGVSVSGDYAYAATVGNGFRVIDVSDPTNPYEVSYCNIPGLVWDSDISGSYVYLAASTQGLQVVDISNPLLPNIVGSYVTGYISGVFVSGGYAYLVDPNYGLRIVDVSDPENPIPVGSCATQGSPVRLVVIDNYAYIASAWSGSEGGGVIVIDVSEPSNPAQIGYYKDYCQYITGLGSYIYAVSPQGLLTLDVSDPSDPELVSTYNLPGDMRDLAISGNYLYTGSNGFRVFDVSDPYYPVQIAVSDTLAQLIEVSGDYAIFAPLSMGSLNDVSIFDISDPFNPVCTGQYTAPYMTWNITVDGHYAYIACWWDGVRIIDFSDPSNPTCVAHVLGWHSGVSPGDFCYAEDVAKSGNYLYIIDYGPFPNDDTKGLYIVDVSNPQDPVVIYRYSDLQSEGYGIDAIGNYVYVADKNGGLEVIDVSDPLNPATTGYCPLPDVAYDVTVSGNYAYVANYIFGGLQVVDVSDPSSPFIAGYYKRTGCFAMKAATQGNLVYVADGPAGFQVYNHIALQPGIDDEYSETSLSILYQNSPNPFRYSTTFKFSLKEASYVKLSVYNIRGQQLATIVDENMKPGYYEIPWSPANEDHALTNGIYYYKLEVGDKTFVKKMMLMR